MACGKQNWSATEITLLLNILKEQKIVERLDSRKSRNNELFKQVFDKLQEAWINRTVEQIIKCWKSGYYKAKSQNNKSDKELVNVTAHGIDVSFPVPEEDSLDGASVTENSSSKSSCFATRAAI